MTQANHTMQKLLQIGTSRAALPFEQDLPPPLRASVQDSFAPEAALEERLWLCVGALDLWTRAGYLPLPAPAASAAPAEVCGQEHLAPCPARAEATLSLLLQGMHPELQPEWLRLLAQRQARLPARYLPNMLELGSRQPALRAPVAAVLGQRGRWLARLNPDWEWAAADLGDSAPDRLGVWQTGTLEQRQAVLNAWRSDDPRAALQVMQAGWAEETPEQRAALLPYLAVGLGLDDEAFLEKALDDKRKEVRAIAQDLLAALPGSALSQRMAARLAPLLRLESTPSGATRLDVTLPAERDKAMQRDGVGAGTQHNLGEKAGWLANMLAAVSPLHWTQLFQMPPRACLALATDTDFLHALVHGWSGAVQRYLTTGAKTQAEALELQQWLYEFSVLWLTGDAALRLQYPRDFFSAYSALPPTAAHAMLARLIDIGGQPWGANEAMLINLLHQLASQSNQTWPASLSLTLVERLFAALSTLTPQHWSFLPILPTFAAVLDPAAIAAFEHTWPGLEPAAAAWQPSIDKFFSAVRFRHEMYLSFQEQA